MIGTLQQTSEIDSLPVGDDDVPDREDLFDTSANAAP